MKPADEILGRQKIYKTDLDSYDVDILMTNILLQEIEENVEKIQEKVFKEVYKPKKRFVKKTAQSLKEYCKINPYDPICKFI